MTTVVPHQSHVAYMTQHPSLCLHWSTIAPSITFSFAHMFTIVLVGLLSAMASCSASACWLSQSVIWRTCVWALCYRHRQKADLEEFGKVPFSKGSALHESCMPGVKLL